MDTQNNVEMSAMASWVRNLSASHKINMLITRLKSPNVIQTKGAEMSRKIGRRNEVRAAKKAAPIIIAVSPPVITKPGKYSEAT